MRAAILVSASLLALTAGCGSESGGGNDDDSTAGTQGQAAGQSGTSNAGSAGQAVGGTSAAGNAGASGSSAGAGAAGSSAAGASGGTSGGSDAGASSAAGGGAGSSGAFAGAAGSGNAGLGGRAGSGGGGTGGANDTAGQGGSGKGGTSGSSGAAGSAGGANDDCPADGSIVYTLSMSANPSADESDAYERITEAMDEALDYYNCYTNISRMLSISYNPSVQTADGNPNGSIRFGSDRAYMNYITAMHETSHVLGVGSNEWDAMIEDGIFTGPVATAELRDVTGIPDDVVHGDNQHFWPYGLNYTSEVMGESDLLNHMRMVVAIREDLSL